jgi:hypothetical protein
MKNFVLSNIVILFPLILTADNGACQPPQLLPDGRPLPSYAQIREQHSCFDEMQPAAKVHHEHRLNFGLLNLGYERIMPNSVYVGADVRVTPFYTFDGSKRDTLNHFINGELRMGYNHSFCEKDTLTSYAGIGFSIFKFEKKEGNIRDWNYATIGVKALHQFGDLFEMGIHVKAYRSIQETRPTIIKTKKVKSRGPIINNDKIRIQDKMGNKLVVIDGKLQVDKSSSVNQVMALPVIELPEEPTSEIIQEKLDASKVTSFKDSRWMMEIGIPLIWHVGQQRNWEIQFEPYYMQIPSAKRLHLLGSRLSFGFRF